MKCLVTGGTGFVGSTLVRHLLQASYEVRILARRKNSQYLLAGLPVEVVDGDINRPSAVENAVKGCEVVFHLASLYAFYPFWKKEAKAIYKINVQGTLNVLQASLKYGVRRFIHTSSIATIGKESDGKLSDENTNFNFRGASHYARSKYLAEQAVLKFCKQGLSAVILNPAIVIGERDDKPTPSGDVIVRFLNQNYPGYFDALWSVADVDDVARAHIAAADHGRAGERYILCNPKHVRLKTIFEKLESISGVRAPRIRIPYPALFAFIYCDEILSHYVLKKKPLLPVEGVRFCKMSIEYDNRKAVKELGYSTTPLEASLNKAVAWYRKNGFVEPAGLFRIKSHGWRLLQKGMRATKMDALTDRLNFSCTLFFLMVRSLQALQNMGVVFRADGWRQLTESYLRTEPSKFALAVFGLKYTSDRHGSEEMTVQAAREHLVRRLAAFLRDKSITHCQVIWNWFSAQRETKAPIDVVEADFDEEGLLTSLKPYFDDDYPVSAQRPLAPELCSALISGIIETYNMTQSYSDKERVLLLRRLLTRKYLKADTILEEVREAAHSFVDRILSATFVSFQEFNFEQVSLDADRFQVPDFIRRKHPGNGLLNIVCHFTHNLSQADLWVQFSHIPLDGVPAQEILNEMKKRWGQEKNIQLAPTPAEQESDSLLCSTDTGPKAVYHCLDFIDFSPFLKLRRDLNRRYREEAKGPITAAALLLWKMAQFEEFFDLKFAVPIDLRETDQRERTLGFVFIRPCTFFDRDTPDRGFFRFQRAFNGRLRATRNRTGESYKLVECYRTSPAWMNGVTAKLMPTALQEFGGTIGLTIIKRADFFVAPYSDLHRDGFIALSNFSIPSTGGKKVCVVSIKGPIKKIHRYKRVLREIMNQSVTEDELYF